MKEDTKNQIIKVKTKIKELKKQENDNGIRNGKELHLVLKHKWYDMIASGVKKEEYREIKPYYSDRFFNNHYTHVVFHKGYTNETMTFWIKNIITDFGKPEWGAEPNELYYVIKLGKRIK